jgi:hypothetical protein
MGETAIAEDALALACSAVCSREKESRGRCHTSQPVNRLTQFREKYAMHDVYTDRTQRLHPLDAAIHAAIPAELAPDVRARVAVRARRILLRLAICAAALALGGLLTVAGALGDVRPLFGLAAAAFTLALVGWSIWFQEWR